MTNERRYGEEEIAAIFEAAAAPRESRRRDVAAAHGLTLSELQSIGSDVGVAPERIAEAAAKLDVSRHTRRRTQLGMPISASRTLDLPRAPTDREWDIIVGELRRTFNAQGKDASRGDLRGWRNGNLHAYVEPTESGYRFRIGSVKGDAAGYNALAIGGMAAGAIVFVSQFVGAFPGIELAGPLALGAGGASAFVFNSLRLRRWAGEREEQMNYMAARVQALLGNTPGTDA